MRLILALMVFVMMALASAASAQSVPKVKPVWPREVQAIYDEFKTQCIAGGGRFVPDRANFAHQIEVTNDGKPDWLVEYEALDCKITDAIRNSDNPPMTTSYFCGSGGCEVVILGSSKSGLKEIYGDNLRGWTVVDIGKGRKGLEQSVHGTACGGFGAEVCLITIAWNGRDWDEVKRYKWTEADYRREQKRQAASDKSYEDGPLHNARWEFASKGDIAIAFVENHPEFPVIALRCLPTGGMFLSTMPAKTTPVPPTGRPLLIDFHGSTEGIRVTQSLTNAAGSTDYDGVLEPALESLLMGRDSGLEMLLSVDGGQEWQELTYLSTTGSTAATRSIGQFCAGQASGTAAKQASGHSPIAPLGIVAGYYLDENESCAAKRYFSLIYYDGKRWGLMYGGGREEWEQNHVGPLGRVQTLGKNRYALPAWDTQVEVLSSTRIRLTIQDTGGPMRWCPADQIAPNYRAK